MSDNIGVAGFSYHCELVDQDGNVVDSWAAKNLIPQAGLDFLIQAPFGDVSPVSTFYCGIFSGSLLPTSSLVASDMPTYEFVGYSEATRPVWTREYDGIGTLDNAASRAQFTFTQDKDINGAFLVSSSTKGGNSGLLISIVRFASPKSISNGLTLNLTSGITYIPTSIA